MPEEPPQRSQSSARPNIGKMEPVRPYGLQPPSGKRTVKKNSLRIMNGGLWSETRRSKEFCRLPAEGPTDHFDSFAVDFSRR
jgi:hypothetical protein